MTTKVKTQMLDQTGNLNITAANVTLGPVANVHISGGTSGQAIITDGAGNLSFGTVASSGPTSARVMGYNLVFGG